MMKTRLYDLHEIVLEVLRKANKPLLVDEITVQVHQQNSTFTKRTIQDHIRIMETNGELRKGVYLADIRKVVYTSS